MKRDYTVICCAMASAIDDVVAGMSYAEAARANGKYTHHVKRACLNNGVTQSTDARARALSNSACSGATNRHAKGVPQEMTSMSDQGATYQEIADAFGVTREVVAGAVWRTRGRSK